MSEYEHDVTWHRTHGTKQITIASHWHHKTVAGGNEKGKVWQLLAHFLDFLLCYVILWQLCVGRNVNWMFSGGSVWGLWATKLQWNVLFSRCCGCSVSIIPPALSIVVHSLTDDGVVNPLNPELNPICYLLALLGAHHFLHVSRIRVKSLTLRRLMSYIYIWSTHSWCF